MERHAAEIYTRAMFDLFSRELFYSGSFEATVAAEGGYYDVVLISIDGETTVPHHNFTVGSSPDLMDFYCQCKMYEHCGIPCRHIIKVFNL